MKNSGCLFLMIAFGLIMLITGLEANNPRYKYTVIDKKVDEGFLGTKYHIIIKDPKTNKIGQEAVSMEDYYHHYKTGKTYRFPRPINEYN